MNFTNSQITDTILMVRPSHFGFNLETANTNVFQQKSVAIDEERLNLLAQGEFDQMVQTLRNLGIHVLVVEDDANLKLPDAIFPNNWFSTHAEGYVITYPMCTENRRRERRMDILDLLFHTFHFSKRYSMVEFENNQQYLEGTGSLILDRVHKIAYACLSPRTDAQLLHVFSELTGYENIFFHAFDDHQTAIYHTNVMMALGTDFVVICSESIPHAERERILQKLKATGKEIIEISQEQVRKFAGNMLQLKSKTNTSYLIMSETAHHSLTQSQLSALEKHTNIISIPIPTIEMTGGGSVRCMMAEIFY